MCGRFALYTHPIELAKIFGIAQTYSFENSYNIAPTENVSVIAELEAGHKQIVLMRWGLIPVWHNPKVKIAPLINARIETIETKPAFRKAFRSRRCLIIADGFFEWGTNIDGKKQPYFIQLRSKEPFAMAGIWERWIGEEETINSCCIITTEANDLIYPLHDRTPGIILPEHYDAWLHSKDNNIELIKQLVTTLENDQIQIHPVSMAVNKATYKGEDCIIWLDTEPNNKQ